MRRALTQTQAAELWRAASMLPPAQRDAFLAAVNTRLRSLPRRVTDDDVAGAIVFTLGDSQTVSTHCFMCDAIPTVEADMAAIDDDDDAFGPDGLLRDGKRTRVSLMMRDSLSDTQRAIADAAARRSFDDSRAKYQPGPIVADRSAAAAVWEDERRAAQEAWRTPAADVGTGQPRGQQPGDQCTIDGQPGHLNDRLVCVPDTEDRRRKRKGVSRDPFGRETGSWEEEEEDSAPAVLPPRTMDAAEARRIRQEAYERMCAEDRDAWRKALP